MKIHTHVCYPATLQLPRECLSDALSRQDGSVASSQYALSSLILHHGKKATGGHYTAYTRDISDQLGGPSFSETGSNTWRHVDDNKITAITTDQAMRASDTVYLLLYTRIHS